MLECKNNGIYTGIAKNVEIRFQLHVEGKGAKYTRMFPPKRILYRKLYPSRQEAASEELRLKGLSRYEKEMLIEAVGEREPRIR
jgi:putative endonuclease